MQEKTMFPSEGAREILRRLETAGEAWLVGGAVRDCLMGRPAQDEDIASSLRPQEVEALFPELPVLETGIRHGTVAILFEGKRYEVTSYRKDGPYLDGRRPASVDFEASIEEDLARRDFTVNAMAMNLRGKLLDPFGGQDDIKNRCIRAVGKPCQRFEEDALRLLRAVRFASRLRFEIEAETREAIREKAPLLERVSRERIADEFLKMLDGDPRSMLQLHELGLLDYCFPELEACFKCPQEMSWHLYDVGLHSVIAAEQGSGLRFRLAALFHDLGKPESKTYDEAGRAHFYGHALISEKRSRDVLDRLFLPKEERQIIARAVALHDTLTAKPGKIARLVREEGEAVMRLLIRLKYADIAAQSPVDREKKLLLVRRQEALIEAALAGPHCLEDLAVNGRDLAELGLSGPKIGEMLKTLLCLVMEKPSRNHRNYLLGKVKRSLEAKKPAGCPDNSKLL